MAVGGDSRRASARGAGLIQILLVLVAILVVVMVALKMYQRSVPPAVGRGSGPPARAVLDRVEFRVEGMTSDVDALQVTEALRRVPGVASASVDFRTARARVTFSPSRTRPEQLIAAVERAGFRARR
ncbi:MAG: heavy-metal-associated domain-containing protein [Terriglobia bacterium]